MKGTIRKIFTLCLLVFMIGGTILVAGQLAGIILQNGQLMIIASEYVGTPTFICASIAGILGFIYSYLPDEKKTEPAGSAGER